MQIVSQRPMYVHSMLQNYMQQNVRVQSCRSKTRLTIKATDTEKDHECKSIVKSSPSSLGVRVYDAMKEFVEFGIQLKI